MFPLLVGAFIVGAAVASEGWDDAVAWQNEQWNNRTGGRAAEYARAVERSYALDRPIVYVRSAADLIDPATGVAYDDDSRVIILWNMLDAVPDLTTDGTFWTEVRRIAGPDRQAEHNIFNLAVADVGSRWQQSRYAAVMGVWGRR